MAVIAAHLNAGIILVVTAGVAIGIIVSLSPTSIPPPPPFSPSLISFMVSVDVKHHVYLLTYAFQHLPPNSARTGYATKGALFISAQLSTDAVSALRKVWVLRLWKQHSVQAPT